MNTMLRHPAREYARVGLETGVAAADPHHMVMLLFDGALRALGDARRHLAGGRIAAKGEAISRAIAIIDEGLCHSLDHRRGGELAGRLHELYQYSSRRLLQATVDSDDAPLVEVAGLLDGLRSAWVAIGEVFAAGTTRDRMPTSISA